MSKPVGPPNEQVSRGGELREKPESRERRQVCIEAEILKERLFRAGLYLSAQKMDTVTRQIGWEVAALEQDKKPPVIP